MRFETFEKFEKRYPKEAAWLRENRGRDSFAGEMYDRVASKSDLSARQRRSILRAAEGGKKPSGMPKRGDILRGFEVEVFQVYTHEDRGEVRFVFRHPDGWVGRFVYGDVTRGRIALRGRARKQGFDETSTEEKQSGAIAFDATIDLSEVAWVGGSSGGYVILEDVEVSIAKRRPRPKVPTPASEPTTPIIFFPDDDELKELPEEEEPEETPTIGVSARGAPIPDMDNWREKLRGCNWERLLRG